MDSNRRKLLVAAAGAGAAACLPAHAADTWPTRPITLVVSSTPGGAVDIVTRLVGLKIGTALGQPVVVENRGGASGIVGTEAAAKAPPDGYLCTMVASSHAINPSMFKKLPYDTLKSFEPVVETHAVPLVLVVNPGVQARNVTELVALLKSQPGRFSYASSGTGGAPQMSAELFKSMAGVDVHHVPYKGSTAAHPDLIAGRVEIMFDTVTAIAPHIRSGAVRPLAVTTTQRSALFPTVPTMAEAGVKGYETSTWGGFLAPAGTPAAIVQKLNGAIVAALNAPDVRERLSSSGIEPVGGSPAQFRQFIEEEVKRWGALAQAAGIKPEE